jgi:hypothetical protein
MTRGDAQQHVERRNSARALRAESRPIELRLAGSLQSEYSLGDGAWKLDEQKMGLVV